MKVPATPYSPTTHPPIPINKLQVGSLYIMISVPLPIYLGREKHTYAAAVPSDPDFPYSTYELGVTDGDSTEEFHWDLYWHTSDGSPSNSPSSSPSSSSSSSSSSPPSASSSASSSCASARSELESNSDSSDSIADEGTGIIYRLRTLSTRPQTYEYDRIAPVARVRTHAQLVGLVRVLSVPPSVVPHLTRYLDWMTAETARVARRTYVWASMAYYRTRLHLTKAGGGGSSSVRDHSFNQFDISRFTAEVLSFAYAEVPSALEGGSALLSLSSSSPVMMMRARPHGPRPVIAAWLGIAVGFLEEDDVVATKRKRDELMRQQREEVGVVEACWYQ